MKTINYSLLWTSRPSTEFVWLEWPEIQQVVIRHPVVCVIIGLILLLII